MPADEPFRDAVRASPPRGSLLPQRPRRSRAQTALFGEGQPHHVDHLTAFTAESFGGPDRFTRELGGFDALIAVHRTGPKPDSSPELRKPRYYSAQAIAS